MKGVLAMRVVLAMRGVLAMSGALAMRSSGDEGAPVLRHALRRGAARRLPCLLRQRALRQSSGASPSLASNPSAPLRQTQEESVQITPEPDNRVDSSSVRRTSPCRPSDCDASSGRSRGASRSRIPVAPAAARGGRMRSAPASAVEIGRFFLRSPHRRAVGSSPTSGRASVIPTIPPPPAAAFRGARMLVRCTSTPHPHPVPHRTSGAPETCAPSDGVSATSPQPCGPAGCFACDRAPTRPPRPTRAARKQADSADGSPACRS